MKKVVMALANGLSFAPEGQLILRLLAAALCGAAIGIERSFRQKDAGVRTHCVIAVGSAVFMILSLYAFADIKSAAQSQTADVGRIAAQVVSGISFMGAGMILKTVSTVRGLATAAGVWFTAAAGLACGCGMWQLAAVSTGLVVLLQSVLFGTGVDGSAAVEQMIGIEMESTPQARQALAEQMRKYRILPQGVRVVRREGHCVAVTIRAKSPAPVPLLEALRFGKNGTSDERI